MTKRHEARERPRDPSIGRAVIDDLRRTRLHRDFAGEIRDLYQFYLDDDTRRDLESMGRLKRALWLLGWLLKSLYLKLAPLRRLILLVALVCAALGRTQVGGVVQTIDLRPTGFLLVLLILMLELKDKLLARDEIEVARQVQLALFPQERPRVPGWEVWSYTRPANDVGGDLIDYVECEEGRLGLVLGDVAGKGLGAALLTAKLQATIRALVPECRSLDELGFRINTILHRDGLDNRYATLFFAVLEPETGRLRFLNAGHNPACVLGPARDERLDASAPPLGMFPSTRYREGRVELAPGDMVLAYSDGLTEATDGAEQEFGLERLHALLPRVRELPAEQAGEVVLEAVDRFLGDRRPADDLSLVIARRAG